MLPDTVLLICLIKDDFQSSIRKICAIFSLKFFYSFLNGRRIFRPDLLIGKIFRIRKLDKVLDESEGLDARGLFKQSQERAHR